MSLISSERSAERPNVPGVESAKPGPLLRIIKDQRIAFLLVGGANTAFSTGLFIVLALLFPHVLSFILLTISWSVSLVSVFFVYRRLVFRVHGHFWLDLGRFALINLSSLLINIGLLTVAADILGLPRIQSQVVITLISVCFSYFGHKYFSFRRKPAVATDTSSSLHERRKTTP